MPVYCRAMLECCPCAIVLQGNAGVLPICQCIAGQCWSAAHMPVHCRGMLECCPYASALQGNAGVTVECLIVDESGTLVLHPVFERPDFVPATMFIGVWPLA